MVRNIVASRDVEAVQLVQAPAPEVPKVMVLVASQDMRMGHTVLPDWLKWEEWPEELASPLYVTQARMSDAVQKFAGAIVRSQVVAGEPILETKFVREGDKSMMSLIVRKGMRAVSLPISAETGAGGFILPGDRVDVMLTHRRSAGARQKGVPVAVEGATEVVNFSDDFITRTILANVRILAIDQVVAEVNGAPAVLGRTATVELTLDQAEMVALAEKTGELSLALRSFADGIGPNGEPNDEAMPEVVLASDLLMKEPEPTEAEPAPRPAIPQEKTISIIRSGVASVMKLESNLQ